MVIELEDHGQEFTELHVDDNRIIVDARPVAGWVCGGYQVIQTHIHPGTLLRLRTPRRRLLVLKYPVARVRAA